MILVHCKSAAGTGQSELVAVTGFELCGSVFPPPQPQIQDDTYGRATPGALTDEKRSKHEL